MLDRYKFQPWYVKAYRWVRFKPAAFVRFLYLLVSWAFHGCPAMEYADLSGRLRKMKHGRRRMVSHFWISCQSLAEYRMRHYVTIEELLAEIKSQEPSDEAK